MRNLFVVLKSMPGIDAPEFVGVFDSVLLAEAACIGAGTFTIFPAELNRIHRSDPLSVTVISKVTAAGARHGIV